MLQAYSKRFSHKLGASVDVAVSRIDHHAVIKDLVARAELSGSYLLMIVFSCLVALLGLLTNSVAVVIGAMGQAPLLLVVFCCFSPTWWPLSSVRTSCSISSGSGRAWWKRRATRSAHGF